MDHSTHSTVWACSRLLLSGPGQCPASGCLPSICTRPGVLRLVHPRPSPKLSRCPLAAAAGAAGDEEPLAADGLGAGAPHARLEQEALLEPQLPEERGAAPAYPGGSIDVLGEQDVHAWQHRVSGAVRLVVASLQQQTLVLALAQHMQGSLDSPERALLEQGAPVEGAQPAAGQQDFERYAAVLERCCERLREELAYLQELREEALVLASRAQASQPQPAAGQRQGAGEGEP